MTFKFGRKYLFIIAVCALLWNQQTNIIAQKIAIENSYQQKVSSALSQMLGQERFLVIVSIEFSTVGGTLKKTGSQQSGMSSSGGYIPGLPTVPSSQGKPTSYRSDSKTRSGRDLGIGPVEVIIGMDETSTITEPKKRRIKSLVEEVIPQTKDCEDCIRFQAMPFQTNQKNAELELLRQEVEKLQSDIRDAKLATDELHLKSLEDKLEKATMIIDSSEKEDSIYFVQLVAADKFRKEQDSLRFVNTEKRLERVMESKIKSDSVIISEQMSILKHQTNGDKSLLGMQIGEGNSSIMGYVLIIFLVISLIVVTFLAANNKKPKTVYLKPKNKKGTKTKKGSDKNKSDSEEDNDTEPTSVPPSPRPDEDTMRSEIRSLRQTAVSLTVGEKEGASALIKEWLEDNPNKQDEGETGGE